MYVIDHHNNLVGVIERENLLDHGSHGLHKLHHLHHSESKALLSTTPTEEDLKGLESIQLEEIKEDITHAAEGPSQENGICVVYHS
jgi:hypothetical protein